MGFPCGSAGQESTCNAGDLGSIPELGRSPGEGKGYPFQYSGLENSMDYTVHGITKSQTRLSDFHFHVQLFLTPWTTVCPAPLSTGFPRQEYWSGLPFPPPGDLPDPGIKPSSPELVGRFFTTEPPAKLTMNTTQQ